MKIPIWTLRFPGYISKKKVAYEEIGKRLDKIIQKNFLGIKILMRCLGSHDHKGKNINELVKTIRKTGTDRYDSKRKMIFHEFYSKHNPDIFMSVINKVTKTNPSMKELIEEFYTKTTSDRKIGVRADIITIYNPKKLKMIKHVYDGQEESDCFTFKDPKNKQKALLGIIKIINK